MAAQVERKSVDKSCLEGLPIVWVMGGPGSGKGTQSERIQIRYDFTHLSSGDLLRHEVMSGSNRGQQLYKLMSTGEAVPDEIVDDIIAEGMVAKAQKSKGFLIDGYPISLSQAEAFENDIGKVKAIVVLEVSDEILKQRLLSRANFDDTEASVDKRISTYREKTLPILEKYADRVKKVNAERPKEEVFDDIKVIFDAMKEN